jgi:methionyl-tRNA synthetase
LQAYQANMDAIEVRKAAAELRALWVLGNEYLQEVAPWATIKEDEAQARMQIRTALNLIRLYGVLSRPFVPEAATAMLDAMDAHQVDWPGDVAAALGTLEPGHAFEVPPNLFAKITDDQREEWQQRFAGIRT